MKSVLRNLFQHCVFGLALSCLSVSVLAVKIDMTPGLWEHAYTMTSKSGDIEKALAEARKQMEALPPAQRKMMEDMLAAQGIGIGNNGQTIKMCITKEQIERGYLPNQDKNCTQNIKELGKGRFSVEMSCKGNPPSTGAGELTFADSRNYTGRFVMNMAIQGKPEAMTMDQTGKWLSESCGDIRPIGN